jgi:hypothetical protein
VIEITLPFIEYVKSAGVVVESDELKVICLLSFTSLNERLPNRGAEASWELLAREIKLFVANLATRGHIGHTNKIGGLVLNERSNERTNERNTRTVPDENCT